MGQAEVVTTVERRCARVDETPTQPSTRPHAVATSEYEQFWGAGRSRWQRPMTKLAAWPVGVR
jgi:hypothetical protein